MSEVKKHTEYVTLAFQDAGESKVKDVITSSIYVDGPNGSGDGCTLITVEGPDRELVVSLLLLLDGVDAAVNA